jgi:virginiamycin B lyase
MPKRLVWLSLVAASLCAALPSRVQAQGRGQPVNLPDGPGKEIVQTVCAKCHALNLIANDGYSREEWRTVFNTMVDLPTTESNLLADYLAKNFPEKPKPVAVVIPGTAKVSFKEWPLPTKGSRPHDPLATPDGALWYTGMFANKLGRVDTKTGQIKEFPLPTAGSGPHGLVADKGGNVWFTANYKGYIGKLDPNTGNVTEYKLPEGTRDPHTPIFDQKGILWFTAQGANRIGRLDPKTGDVKVVTSPTERSNPYGMVVNSKGVPFLDLFGTNKIASIDPNTMEIKEYPLPNEATRPRRIGITSDDIIWYTDYSRGYLGRLDPATGSVTEWPSPSGPKSLPYGIAVYRDVIWYSESGVRPNTLVRFDPKTQKFQTWVIPGGGGVVRNMMVTRDGNFVLAESGLNMVALVEVGK